MLSEVGGSAALMELEMRLLANKVKEIEEASFAWDVSKTEDAVIKYFTKEALLTEEECKLLTAASYVRNNFLYGKFNTAIVLVEEYFKQKSKAKSVDMIKFDPTSKVPILDQLLSHFNRENEPTAVATATLKEGVLFGWFLQAFQSESLGLTLNLMTSALKISERLSLDHAKADQI